MGNNQISGKVRQLIYKREAATDEYGYKDDDYVVCAACGKWHQRNSKTKSIHHIDSNRFNNEEYNLVVLCEGMGTCHPIWHRVSIKNQEKTTIALSLYSYMVKLYPDKADHYRKNFKIDMIPEAQRNEIKLENITGGYGRWKNTQ